MTLAQRIARLPDLNNAPGFSVHIAVAQEMKNIINQQQALLVICKEALALVIKYGEEK